MDLFPGAHSRLGSRHAAAFAGATLFDRIGQTVCAAGCLPRKELFEAWETARRVRRRLRGGHVVDLAAGHGLLAWLLLLLDDTSPAAICVDVRKPPSAERLRTALVAAWPRLAGRVAYVEAPVAEVTLPANPLLVSVHGCGGLTDEVLTRAIAANAPVAVLPCCHAHKRGDDGGLGGWLSTDLAQDVTRAARLREAGYHVWTQTISSDVTSKNRLLIGRPR